MLEKSLILPPKNGQGENETLVCREPVVLIGANGSGKSRLGLWIEQNQVEHEKVHRISAQRALDFGEYGSLKSLEQAQEDWLFGDVNARKNWGTQAKQIGRWQLHNRPNSVTPMLNDYEKVLSVLFATKAQRDSELAEHIRKMEREDINERPKIIDSPDEILCRLWDDLLPHRKLVIKDAKITVSSAGGNIYQGREMSDGERVALYLMAQCLCVPKDSVVIIDEPEIHLHKSLMSKLWSQLEESQPDCLFIYITHDIDFAASRVGARKIWIKNYNGMQWEWDEVPKAEGLPASILLEVLGSRKKILFVEGDKGSLDCKIYQAIYPNYLIMPRGSCAKVIESTRVMRDNPLLNHVEAFGIIDVDYRSEKEVNSLKDSGIFVLNVAEIENIFCVPEILEVVAKVLAKKPEDVFQEASIFVIDALSKELEEQTSKRSVREIEFKLHLDNKKIKNKIELSQAFGSLAKSISADEIYDKNYQLYETVIAEKDYKRALLLYNNKGLSKRISSPLGLKSGEYRDFVVRLLSTEHRDSIISGLKNYAPTLEEAVSTT
jgi:ABC-type dipeptide/oligopeptide/nickel transport system ATPase component